MAAVAAARYRPAEDDGLENVGAYLNAHRPWMSLLGVRLRPAAAAHKERLVRRRCWHAARPASMRAHAAAAVRRNGAGQTNHSPRFAPTLQAELSLIEQLLPEELLLHIFERLPITALGTAQCVCAQWRRVGATQTLWRRACRCGGAGPRQGWLHRAGLAGAAACAAAHCCRCCRAGCAARRGKPLCSAASSRLSLTCHPTLPPPPNSDAFFTSTSEQNAAQCRAHYRGCWKRMLLERPHLRFDGARLGRAGASSGGRGGRRGRAIAGSECGTDLRLSLSSSSHFLGPETPATSAARPPARPPARRHLRVPQHVPEARRGGVADAQRGAPGALLQVGAEPLRGWSAWAGKAVNTRGSVAHVPMRSEWGKARSCSLTYPACKSIDPA